MKEQGNMNKKIISAKIRLGDKLAIIYIKELKGFFIEHAIEINDGIFNQYYQYCLIGKGNQAYRTNSPNHKNYLMFNYFTDKNTIKGNLEEIIDKALLFSEKELKDICENAHEIFIN